MTLPMIDAPRPRRWDAVVRVTHWAMVAAVVANALFTEGGSITHIWIGYALAAVLALRLVWGLIGSTEARFSAFPPSPRRAIAHIREILAGEKHAYASHNPLGALMVYATWGCLTVLAATGILIAGLPDVSRAGVTPYAHVERPHSEARDGDGEREAKGEEGLPTEIHEVAANLLYVLVALHLAGVVFETRRSGRQIVQAMLPGRRRPPLE